MKGMALQIKDGKGESVYRCYLVLLPTSLGTARHRHLTVHDLLYLAGYTVFATLLFTTWQAAQRSPTLLFMTAPTIMFVLCHVW